MKNCIAITLLLFFMMPCFAQPAVPSATEVLNAAYKKATTEKKNIFLIFHASWCGWCHKMDSAINNPACKKFFDDNYLVVHLTVYESPGRKAMENKGAEELLKKYGAFDKGIPFWVVLDKDGKLLKDSFIKQADGSTAVIGCPASEKEVAALLAILKTTSSLTDQELEIISQVFRKIDSK